MKKSLASPRQKIRLQVIPHQVVLLALVDLKSLGTRLAKGDEVVIGKLTPALLLYAQTISTLEF